MSKKKSSKTTVSKEENNPILRTADFPCVIEAGKMASEQLKYYKKMMKPAKKKKKK